ncbi:MAG: hypothetical protein NTV97_30470 [Alphaproteobacteria bacterium]|nr:hypothetical protein [Alphaproteobacteria bacterium]
MIIMAEMLESVRPNVVIASIALSLASAAGVSMVTTPSAWAQAAVAAPFDDVEAQLRVRQAANAVSTSAREVAELRNSLEAEGKRVVQTSEERDLNRETIKALEKKLREAEANQRDREAALEEAQEARNRGLALSITHIYWRMVSGAQSIA